MDNERHNERMEWSRRLEEPGALPGIGLTDKEATWDKLYERLQEKPRRRTLPWLWAAAACLLLALIPAAFFLKQKGHVSYSKERKVTPQPVTPEQTTAGQAIREPSIPGRAVTQPSAPGQTATRRALPGPSTFDPSASEPSAVHPASPEPSSPGRSDSKPSIPTPSAVAQNIPSSGSDTRLHAARREQSAPSLTRLKASFETLSLTPVRTSIPEVLLPTNLSKPAFTIAAQTAHKKELRVIHINELEPPHSAPAVAGQRQKPGRLQIGFHPSQDVLRPATTYETFQTDHPIISFKHTANP